MFGFLKLLPGDLEFWLPGDTINAEFLGGIVFPGIIFTIIALVPWIDRTNRHTLRRFEYMEPSRQAPVRTAAGLAMIAYILTLFLAAYYNEIGMSLALMWMISIIVPVAVFVATIAIVRRIEPDPESQFDPRTEDLKTDVTENDERVSGATPAD